MTGTPPFPIAAHGYRCAKHGRSYGMACCTLAIESHPVHATPTEVDLTEEHLNELASRYEGFADYEQGAAGDAKAPGREFDHPESRILRAAYAQGVVDYATVAYALRYLIGDRAASGAVTTAAPKEDRRRSPHARPFRLLPGGRALLAFLRAQPGPCSVAEIASARGVHPSSVTSTCAAYVRRGWLAREKRFLPRPPGGGPGGRFWTYVFTVTETAP